MGATRPRQSAFRLIGGPYAFPTQSPVVGDSSVRIDDAAGGECSPPGQYRRTDVAGVGAGGWLGSTIGPTGAVRHRRRRRQDLPGDPRTGGVTTYASGLPKSIVGIGGAMDVAFIGGTAYALVTLVGPDVGGSDIVGIYRVDGPDSFTVVADIGAFSLANPPGPDFFVPTGVQYAIEPTAAGSWSPMGTTTGCCGSPSTATC